MTDEGSDANKDLSVWRADVSKDPGFYSLGDVGLNSYTGFDPPVYLISSTNADDLAIPTDLERIWKDTGSDADNDFSFWKPIAPAGYTCLGSLGKKGYEKPHLGKMRCVKSSLVRLGTWELLWKDKGSGANKNV